MRISPEGMYGDMTDSWFDMNTHVGAVINKKYLIEDLAGFYYRKLNLKYFSLLSTLICSCRGQVKARSGPCPAIKHEGSLCVHLGCFSQKWEAIHRASSTDASVRGLHQFTKPSMLVENKSKKNMRLALLGKTF